MRAWVWIGIHKAHITNGQDVVLLLNQIDVSLDAKNRDSDRKSIERTDR